MKKSKLFLFCLTTFISNLSYPCTGIQLTAADGGVINGRTVEFATIIELDILAVPRNYEFTSQLPNNQTGMKYKAKYAAIGAYMDGEKVLVDGVNEKGIAVGMFYFPGYAGYANVTSDNKDISMSPIEFPNWVLTQFSSLDEVKSAIAANKVSIANTVFKSWNIVPPMHYIVYDKSGKSIVIEPIDGKLVVSDNPIGVITNSPNFEWHMTNLRNYLNVSPFNASSEKINGLDLSPFGEGSGLEGLPGSFTPPARFVRAAFFSHTAAQPKTTKDAVFQVFHILNQFDIPLGSVREKNTNNMDFTLFTSVKDTKNLSYYFKSYDNQNITVAHLNSFNLDGKDLKTIKINKKQSVVEVK